MKFFSHHCTLGFCRLPDWALLQNCRYKKAYGTGCSQAVPHPSTIPARRCLTSVIRRERVCSSWYGRRRQLVKSACSHSTLAQIGYVYGHTCSRMPQVQKNHIPGRPSTAIFKLQIKNIKLHIVTDIKVTFNSMLGFRISIFGWGEGTLSFTKKSHAKIQPIIKLPL